jgi:hypothetical protein
MEEETEEISIEIDDHGKKSEIRIPVELYPEFQEILDTGSNEDFRINTMSFNTLTDEGFMALKDFLEENNIYKF